MDLKELRYFRAIAEFGTFSKAAAHLRVAQPALSRQMQKLEHSLGVELLRRSSRGVTPTAAGAALLKRTIFLENELEEARREVSNFSEQVIGTLRVAVTYPLSTLMVPQLIADYRERFPNVALHIIDGYSGNITDSLLAERLDVSIVHPPSHGHVDLTVIPLWTAELRIAGPASAVGSPLFAGEAVPLAEVAELPLIMPSQSSSIRRLVDHAFARHHLRFLPSLEADGPAMIFAMVAAGLGYTLFPQSAFYDLEQRGEIVSRALVPTIRRTMAVVTRTALLDERPVAHFVSMAKAAAARIATTEQFGSSTLYLDEMEDVHVGSPAPVSA